MIEQLHVRVTAAHAELAVCELFDLGAVAVAERSGDDANEVVLVAGFAGDVVPASLIDGLRWARRAEVVTLVDDGLDRWREHARPVVVGPLAIVPAWLPNDTGIAREVRIEPGRAFGIGDHPATQLALAALIEFVGAGTTVLDVGCGTGVLAIAAARLGASRAVAIDIDAHAREVAAANVAANDVTAVVEVVADELGDRRTPFDVVVANLGGVETLGQLRDDLVRLSGSVLVVSGLLSDQVDAALALFESFGEADVRHGGDTGWAAIAIRRDRPGSCTD